MPAPIIGDPYDSFPLLFCSTCQDESSYLHHVKTELFERKHEDADSSMLSIEGHTVKFTAKVDNKRNPSSRRHAVRLFFACELCEGGTILELPQHKGQTFITAAPWINRPPNIFDIPHPPSSFGGDGTPG